MKPRSLTLSAFGPFGGTVRVDFDELARRSLFLIHGATGAGKTTLLDAMSFALYGVTSGGDRSARQMRSHHASPRTKTEVTFEFEVRHKRYRLKRAPEQERPKSRGRGTTTLKSEVSLEVREADLEDDSQKRPRAVQGLLDFGGEAFTTLATKAGEVDALVTELLGLSADQFRQVVLLPQDRFRALLLASSRERQEILESLFGTERYRRLEEALREESGRLKQAIAAERERRALLLDQVGLEAGTDPVAELQKLDAAGADLAGEVARRGQELDEARHRAERARSWARCEKERREAAAERAKLEAERADREADRERLAVAARAAEVVSPFERLVEARRAVSALEERHGAAEAALASAKEEREAAFVRAEAERAKSGEAEEASARRQALLAQAEQLNRWAQAQEQVARLERELVEQGAALQRAEQALTDQSAASARKADELDEARLLAGQVEGKRGSYVRLLQARKTWLRREEVEQAHHDLQRKQAGLIDDVARSEDDLKAAEAARDRAEAAWIRGQAAELAKALVPGESCPVCGSTEHPAPERAGTAGEHARRQLAKSREEADRSRDRLSTLRAEQARLEGEQAGLTKEIALLTEQLDERAFASREELDAEVDRSGRAVEAAEEAFDQLEAKKAAAAEAEAARADAQAALEAARAAGAATEGKLTEAKAVVAERAAGLPDDLRAEGALARALAEVEASIQALQAARAEAETALASAERKLAGAEEAFRHLKADRDEATRRRTAAEAAFAEALQAAGFDEEAFQAARLEPQDRQQLEGRVQRWASRVLSAADRLERAEEALGAFAEPLDPEAARAAEAETAERHAEAIRRQADLEAKREQLRRAVEGMSSADKRTEELEARYAVVGRLAEVALGDNPHRMTFQRFVLATLLDEVLQTASERLSQMSRGRYLLRRSQAPSGRRRAQGLELCVVDQHTGTERPAATLSGGESFLAALSLALGLADAVRARAGGRPLEAIFIDEGFGGLDPEALDLALEALGRLKDSGRTVGIISHVAELRERVEAQLMVKPGRRGSRIERKLG